MCCCNNRCSCESRPCDYLYFSFSYDTLCYVERVQVADAILILNYTATHHSASDRRLNLRQRTPPSMYCWQTSRRNTGLLNSPVGRSSSTDEGTVTAGWRVGCSRLFVRKTMRCFSASARLLCFHQQSWTTVPSAIRSRLETDRVYWPRVPLGVRTGADCSICK